MKDINLTILFNVWNCRSFRINSDRIKNVYFSTLSLFMFWVPCVYVCKDSSQKATMPNMTFFLKLLFFLSFFFYFCILKKMAYIYYIDTWMNLETPSNRKKGNDIKTSIWPERILLAICLVHNKFTR